MANRFTTVDIEYADVYLPSICQIAILDWEDGRLADAWVRLIDPECEYMEMLEKRHGIGAEQTESMEKLRELWIEIYDRLAGKCVVMHNAAGNIRALGQLAAIEHLHMPNLYFASFESIVLRTWPWLPRTDLETTFERLGIRKKKHEAGCDAWAVGKTVQMALQDSGCEDLSELFWKTGFAGGKVQNRVQIPYRSRKKKEGGFAALFRDETEMNWEDCLSAQHSGRRTSIMDRAGLRKR